jgi:hypothetical protein
MIFKVIAITRYRDNLGVAIVGLYREYGQNPVIAMVVQNVSPSGHARHLEMDGATRLCAAVDPL